MNNYTKETLECFLLGQCFGSGVYLLLIVSSIVCVSSS